jgi:hypothetical protein
LIHPAHNNRDRQIDGHPFNGIVTPPLQRDPHRVTTVPERHRFLPGNGSGLTSAREKSTLLTHELRVAGWCE